MPHPAMTSRNIIIVLATMALFICGCSKTLTVRDDNRSIDEVLNQANELVTNRAYGEAAEQFAIASLKEPETGLYYFRTAELLERVDKDEEAYSIYQKAIELVPPDDPYHLPIMHRLALINANHLFKIEEAEELLTRMPEKSIEHLDTAAFLFYQASQFDESLKLLNKALQRVRSADMKALLLYHAALIYIKMKDQSNLFGSLYYSINNAQHLGLIRDIEQLWEELNKVPEGGRSIIQQTDNTQ